jgi:DUF1680 family protein
MQVGRYAYAFSDRDVYVNLFVGGTCRLPLAGREVLMRVTTDYPWDGRVTLRIESAAPARFALHLRQPAWATPPQGRAELRVNDAAATAQADDCGYLTIDRQWNNGDTVTLTLDMPVQRLIAHPNLAAARGKVALQRGPVVFGFEAMDNSGRSTLVLGENPKFSIEHRTNLLGSIIVIKGATEDGGPIQAIPFYTLANRGKSSQEVWVEQRGLKQTDDWWLGSLYRALPNR